MIRSLDIPKENRSYLRVQSERNSISILDRWHRIGKNRDGGSLVTQLCPNLCNPTDYSPPGSSVHGDSPGKNTGVGCQALLQGIFPTQRWNPGLPHCRWILHQLSHQGSPNIEAGRLIWRPLNDCDLSQREGVRMQIKVDVRYV